ncbi:arrestin domain-containing protein 17-like [Penaeus chinensis]|uniref:arrestin domain-containing protein 17-like n=1 Tax=Penaeus chinensis TaxID=139456 RepID=UPI001FB5E74E|nr:arrestin domain-containing protein 17-like [Penaeus chinensis]
MGFGDFTVVIEPHQPVYFSEQVVQGYVKVVLEEPVPCRGIKVTCKGVGKVSWSEKRGKTRVTYSASEEYFRETLDIWSGDDTDETFPAGEHTFPFAFQIPKDIPSSFESEIGKVRYQVKAVADRPWQIDDSSKAVFSVNHLYDLSSDSSALLPINNEREKSIRCCCVRWGPISLTLGVERRGYVGGENLVINGEIVNNSGSTIKYTEAKIVQNISYITNSKIKTVCHTVQRVYRPQIQNGGTDEWSGVALPVPAVTASHLMHCNIIDVKYLLIFEAKLGTCRTAKITENIIIGSIPLPGTIVASDTSVEAGGTVLASTISDGNSPSFVQSSHPGQGRHGDNPPSYNRIVMPEEYANIPPPSYESCIFGGGQQSMFDNDSDNDEGGFAPHYITYRRN